MVIKSVAVSMVMATADRCAVDWRAAVFLNVLKFCEQKDRQSKMIMMIVMMVTMMIIIIIKIC